MRLSSHHPSPHGSTLPHGHLPVLGASVHVEHLLLVVMLAMLAVVIALVRFYNRDERCFSRSPGG